jgi:ribulose-phosphate 3-epimerase
MDGCFCPMLTVGAPFVKGLRTPLLKDAHLMVNEPLDKLADFAAAGADIITVHVEAAVHIHRVLQRLGTIEHAAGADRGVVRGLALNPGTPVEWLTPTLLEEVDVVSLLAVDPGWSGQKFSPATMERIARVKEKIGAMDREILLSVDGGITKENVAEVAKAGADIVAAGSAVFARGEIEGNARHMLEAVHEGATG